MPLISTLMPVPRRLLILLICYQAFVLILSFAVSRLLILQNLILKQMPGNISAHPEYSGDLRNYNPNTTVGSVA